MKNYIIKIVLALNFIISAVPLLAFPGDPDGTDDPPFEDPMPIDTNIWVLVLTAVLLGIAYILHRNKGLKLV